jgi:hypothetical protein
MPIVPTGVVQQAEIDRRVKEVARKLAPDVVRIRYAITLDSTGEEAVFFRILLSDEASRERRLRSVTERIESELLAAIPFDAFGLYHYFSYRNRSEHAMLKEPAW